MIVRPGAFCGVWHEKPIPPFHGVRGCFDFLGVLFGQGQGADRLATGLSSSRELKDTR